VRALAEFILRGRIQAFVVATLGSIFPLVSSATVGLVSLTKGIKEGILVFLWVSMPLLLLQQMSADNPLLMAVSIASLGIMVFAAVAHSLMASWQWTLLVILVVATFVVMSFYLLMGSYVDALVTAGQAMLLNAKQQGGQIDLVISVPLLLGFVAIILFLGCFMSLVLARWWQALLYNPGGFQKEFHSFSLDAKIAVLLILIVVVVLFLPADYLLWAYLVAFPLLFAGIALAHHVAKQLNLGNQWLAFLYVGLIIVGKPMTVALVGIGLADSLIDLRSKLAEYKKP
jgi:hypothetical protein